MWGKPWSCTSWHDFGLGEHLLFLVLSTVGSHLLCFWFPHVFTAPWTLAVNCEAEATWYSEGVKDTGTRLDGSEAHPCGLLIAWLSGDSISKSVKWDTSLYLQGLLGGLDIFLALHFKKCLGNFNCYQEFIPKLHWNLLVTCLMYLLGWEPWKGRVVSAVWP